MFRPVRIKHESRLSVGVVNLYVSTLLKLTYLVDTVVPSFYSTTLRGGIDID